MSRFELLPDELQVPLIDSEKLRKLKNVNLYFAERVHMMDFNNCNGFIAACRKVQNFINVRDSPIHNSIIIIVILIQTLLINRQILIIISEIMIIIIMQTIFPIAIKGISMLHVHKVFQVLKVISKIQ